MKRLLCYVLLTAMLLTGCGSTVQIGTEQTEGASSLDGTASTEKTQTTIPSTVAPTETTTPTLESTVPSTAVSTEATTPTTAPTVPSTAAPTEATKPTTAPAIPCTTAPTEATKPKPESTAPSEPATPENTEQETDPVTACLEGMTLREKVGQLFIVELEQLDSNAVTEVTDKLRENLREYPVGGVILFDPNAASPKQLRSLISQLQEASNVPLFISIDEEGGRVARLANNQAFNLPTYESAGAVGSSGNTEDALEMGRTIGGYLKEYGINLNFAPVADVNTNPDNPIIGPRAFSADPVIAGKMARAFADGLRENRIAATFKHFPGHGDTAEDSHLEIAVNNKPREELLACEWLPFQKADRLDMVMVGHIALPQVTGDMTPATVSATVVTELLREEVGFDGLVITDALDMKAITKQYSPGQAAVSALQAGCDILLMPEDLQEAYDGVLTAVEEGTLSMQWLDATVLKILQFKAEYGMLAS